MADTVIGVTAGEIEKDGESHEERNGGGIGSHSLAREGPGARNTSAAWPTWKVR